MSFVIQIDLTKNFGEPNPANCHVVNYENLVDHVIFWCFRYFIWKI